MVAKANSRNIGLIAIIAANFVVSLMCVPSNSLPRTEVLEIVSSPASQQNGTEWDVKGNGTNICMTKGCVKASALVLDLIDENVNPCDNFYEFACGKFLRNTLIPDDKIAMMSFVHVQDKVLGQLRLILNEKLDTNESKPFTLAKIFNTACMDEETLEIQGIAPMVEILDKYGGWPVVKGDWDSEKWDWMEAYQNMSSDGLDDNILFSLNILTDQRNSSRRVLDLDQADFGLRMEFLQKGLEDTNVKAYYEFMVDAAVIFGANKSAAEEELLDSLKFEIELAKIAVPEGERRNLSALYNPFTIRQLQATYPYLNWLECINGLLPESVRIDEDEVLIVDVPNYYMQLGPILQATPKRTIANYFAWRSVFFGSALLNSALHRRKLQFLATTIGLRKLDPRYNTCVTLTSHYLPISVGALYVRRYFDEESKKAAVELVNSIREEFIKILRDVSWMDDETRAAAIEKAKSMTSHIAYPDELTNNNKLEEYYDGLELESNTLLQNVLRIRIFKDNHLIKGLRTPVNKTDWQTHTMPATVNAAYNPLENSIQLPAAILQDRFFSADRPSYLNFGSIGQIIGHEITHGFDDQGRQFDLDGNLIDWWEDETEAKFGRKAQCMVEQYSNYVDFDSNLRLNGINTQGENIADNGGVKEAYAAYRNYVKRNGAEQLLPGLNYTQEQLFWISSAQTWCAVTRPEFDKMLITTDVHSPNEFRVIGTISNMQEFAHDFSCEAGNKMNPFKKCEVW
ncbi:neprilysin-2-like [Contarinia nasturtii]|uniref:neprilysin-2-like n=1 Tax=Contarinia nasturtii TaxID=265458 RepID=UPI0012D47162|nr:neprilysin-2-like [Contarinia nasturtii]XP_031626098.1 neprilysin-2-like [Contarinia nasturtii]